MAGIYLHIPYCKQACHYCDFHFSTSLKTKQDLLKALVKEARMQKNYFSDCFSSGTQLQTLYFGGGTPSLLDGDELKMVMDVLTETFPVSPGAEATLEANPDDLDAKKLYSLVQSGINRLSIGIQSFHDEDLRFMNRVHNSSQAEASVKRAQDTGITNISIDLIYGTPTMDAVRWKQNLQKAFSLEVPHLSCYALTVEEKTPLSHFIRTGKAAAPDEQHIAEQFDTLVEATAENGFEHYEISNFAKPGFHSRHNSSYWKGQPYLGLGPAAHSYNGVARQWNVRSNAKYIQSIGEGKIPCETEVLTVTQRFNEYVMVSLRTKDGIDMDHMKKVFGEEMHEQLLKELEPPLAEMLVEKNENHYRITQKGKLFADRIASDLFIT
jgi:oxygen-independent coproporphyrinogen-3 oxidase